MPTSSSRRASLLVATGVLVVAVVGGSAWWRHADAGHPSAGPAPSAPSTQTAAPTLATLVPSPKVAAAEQNQASTDGCELAETAQQNAPECRYLPDQGHGDVVLIGDSHAAQWLPAVKAAAASQHWGLRVWTRANCPFADITKISHGAPNAACNSWRENAVQRLISSHPSLVVVASYPPPGGPSLYDPSTQSVVRGIQGRPLYTRGMITELRRLANARINTLLIEDIPRYSQTAPQCALAHPTDFAACSRPEADAEQSAPDRAAAAAVPQVHTLDLTKVFCQAGRCHQIIGDLIAYRDNNHLSHEMAGSLTPQVRAAMIAAAG